MSPERSKTIGFMKIEEYYWAGKMVVYINNVATSLTFEEAVIQANQSVQGADSSRPID